MMILNLNSLNINEYGRFDDLKSTVDKTKAKAYFEKLEGQTLPPFKVNIKVHNLLQSFILNGGFEIENV
jgi:type I restriction enzyme R subunit